jgi:hypothetical protein
MATPWTVPPTLWAGKTVLVLAGGPSLLQSLPVAREAVAAGVAVAVAVNNAGIELARPDGSLVPAMAPWAEMLYAADSGWWQFHAQQALKFPGLKVSIGDAVVFPAVLSLRNTGGTGFDPDPSCLRTGGNSAYQAAHIAAHAGAKRILLCGVDCHDRAGSHWHGDHPAPLRNNGVSSFRMMLERWPALGEALAARGIEIINCSPGSALQAFPIMSLEQALCRAPSV